MPYPGGKEGVGVYQTIINQLVPHRRFIEAFLGGGAIMRHKRPADSSIGIDADRRVVQAARDWGVPGLVLVHGDALTWLRRADLRPDDLVYLDPPYLKSTRRAQSDMYRHEFGSDEQHEQLLQLATRLPCYVAISGYYSLLYQQYLGTWRHVIYNSPTRGGGWVPEWLWMNYPAPWALHDYSYIGENKRKRQDFKRMVQRWRRRLAEMDQVKRLAIMAAISEFAEDDQGGIDADRGQGRAA